MTTDTPEIAAKDAERFWSKVDKSGDCWLWMAYVTPTGYGQFGLSGRVCRAHRVSYELAFGGIPEGLVVDHMCHVKSCVNPDHLRAVTTKQNGENRIGARSDSASRVRGVSWYPRHDKWRARVGHHGARVLVGYFDSLKEAEVAVEAKRKELFTPLPQGFLKV